MPISDFESGTWAVKKRKRKINTSCTLASFIHIP
jgi:hypothetical protein